MDKVVHFEIPAEDLERAQDFYKSIFGWEMDAVPQMNYTIVHTVEIDENRMPKEAGAINGGMMKKGLIKSPVITINVEDVDDALARIEEAGGKIILGKQTVGDMGFSAYFEDTEGNVLGLWEPKKSSE